MGKSVLLVVYDNESLVAFFPQGLAYIAAALRNSGHEVTIYNQDVHHYPDEHLTAYLDAHTFDVVAVSVIGGYYQYRKLLRLSEAINRSKNRPYYIIGGHGPSPEPEYFLNKTQADVVVIGEGEITIVELLSGMHIGKVKGVAWVDGGVVVINEPRPLVEDIDDLPVPAYDLFPIEFYRLYRVPHATNTDMVMPVLSGRGCHFKCAFCYRMDKGLRIRSSAAVVDEIKYLNERWGINHIDFSDELLMSSEDRVIDLCAKILTSGLKLKWNCNGRLNYAKMTTLALMKRAGCVYINYGIESLNDEVLRLMNKALTVDMVIRGVEATIAAGITPGLNFMFGSLGDTPEILDRNVKFIIQNTGDDYPELRTIRPVTPYPGSPLYYYAIEQGLLKDCEDFYENKHVNSDLCSVNFTNLTDDEFHHYLFLANSDLIDNYYEAVSGGVVKVARKLYKNRNTSFRGFRQV